MAQNRVGIVGAGAAGCAVACFAKGQNLTLFDNGEPLRTLLYTGGGRCNLAHAQYDFKELAKNYPRGEKFLYSVFSRFATPQTLEFFKEIGVDTYTQEDDRIFPKSNSAKDVREKILNHAYKNKAKFIKENVYKIEKINDVFIINEKYEFDKIVISTGGHSGYAIIKPLGHSIIEPKPALVGLITEQKHGLEGVSLKNIEIKVGKRTFNGDMLFTKNGVSGPIIYTISSIFARTDYGKNNPLKLSINFGIKDLELDKNGKKDLKTVLSTHMPKSVAEYICNEINAKNQRCCEITKELRTKLEKHLTEFPLTVIGHEKHGEVVTSGGVSLNEINPKTMESKLIKNLYFCGEVVDIDGFCGGYNLQNAWSTAYIVSEALCYNEA